MNSSTLPVIVTGGGQVLIEIGQTNVARILYDGVKTSPRKVKGMLYALRKSSADRPARSVGAGPGFPHRADKNALLWSDFREK